MTVIMNCPYCAHKQLPPSVLTTTGYCFQCGKTVMCVTCNTRDACDFYMDVYNTDGDCLGMK